MAEFRLIPQSPGDAPYDRWTRWRDIPLAILAWMAVAGVVLWLLSHIAEALVVMLIAALIAYALSPLVQQLKKFMPRVVAIALVYIVFFGGLGAFAFIIVSTSIHQLAALAHAIRQLTQTNGNQQAQVIVFLEQLGFSDVQIHQAGQQIITQFEGVTSEIVPVVISVFTTLLDMIIVAVLSIYFMVEGGRIKDWLQTRLPVAQRDRVNFTLSTFERVVGGYIRGELILSTLIGLLVGTGMWIFRVPYAVLLGFLAFILEFIPVLGTLTSGIFCVIIALSQGWWVAFLVLVYFVAVHILEGYIVGPRIVGRAVGLHPAISLVALLAGAELFGILGALFAAPTAGVVQAFIHAGWIEWQELHPEQFPARHGESASDTSGPIEVSGEADPSYGGHDGAVNTNHRPKGEPGPGGGEKDAPENQQRSTAILPPSTLLSSPM